ncbi:MAG: hypothetical protein Q9196_006618 [Gyalolechia fulgens]
MYSTSKSTNATPLPTRASSTLIDPNPLLEHALHPNLPYRIPGTSTIDILSASAVESSDPRPPLRVFGTTIAGARWELPHSASGIEAAADRGRMFSTPKAHVWTRLAG